MGMQPEGFAALSLAALLGCVRASTPDNPTVSAGQAAMPSCAQAWQKLPPAQRDYNFATDAVRTEEGNRGYAKYAARTNRSRCYKDWTLLVYMAADYDDLKPYAYMNLHEMESPLVPGQRTAGSTVKTDLLVQLDTPGNRGLRRLHIFQTPAEDDAALTKESFAQQKEADLRSPIVQLLPEPEHATFADAARDLQSFLSWGIKNYPARHYMVVVWGHGLGWAPAQQGAARPPAGGIALDQTQGTYLDTPLLRTTLLAVVGSDLGGRPFDIYAADACLMQSIEVATELSGAARFVVGSAQVQPFTGLPYRQLLHALNGERRAAPPPPAQEDEVYPIAALLPKLAAETQKEGGLQARLAPDAARTFTLSTLRAGALPAELVPALHEVGRALHGWFQAAPARAIEFGILVQKMGSFRGGATDIGYFLERTKEFLLTTGQCRLVNTLTEEGVRCADAAATQLLIALVAAQQTLHRAVVSAAYGSDYVATVSQPRFLGFAGLSVWLPRSAQDYQNRIADFASAEFYRAGRSAPDSPSPWRTWLADIFAPSKQ